MKHFVSNLTPERNGADAALQLLMRNQASRSRAYLGCDNAIPDEDCCISIPKK